MSKKYLLEEEAKTTKPEEMEIPTEVMKVVAEQEKDPKPSPKIKKKKRKSNVSFYSPKA